MQSPSDVSEVKQLEVEKKTLLLEKRSGINFFVYRKRKEKKGMIGKVCALLLQREDDE